MEKVQCDEPPIMKLGCLASLGPFRNTYLQENMVLFRGMCELVSCSYLRSDKSYECFLQKKNASKHSMRVFCTALILLCWNASFTSHNVQTLRDSWSPRRQFWRQKLISHPKSLAKSTHKHKSKLIQLKSIFHKMVDGCCWLVRTRGWNSIFF